MLKPYLERLIKKQSLSAEDCENAIKIILEEDNTHQTAAFLALLQAKGAGIDEILGITRAMQKHMLPVSVPFLVLDIVGTGGDGSNSVNISTAASLLAAACGVYVAKHGNRSSSSLCGSADFIQALNIPLESKPEALTKSIEKHRFGFMFAPHFHPAAKKIAPVRKGLRFRTVFNLIGPLLNPAKAQYQLIGVSQPELMDVIANVVFKLGTVKTWVFHGHGLDEITCIGPTDVLEITPKSITSFQLNPMEYGLPLCTREDLQGGLAIDNASILMEVFSGRSKGAIANTLALNAGAALAVYGTVPSIQEGVQLAQETLCNKQVLSLIQKLSQTCIEN